MNTEILNDLLTISFMINTNAYTAEQVLLIHNHIDALKKVLNVHESDASDISDKDMLKYALTGYYIYNEMKNKNDF
jgi:hypothetical protein